VAETGIGINSRVRKHCEKSTNMTLEKTPCGKLVEEKFYYADLKQI
jgi:hypothetical protein